MFCYLFFILSLFPLSCFVADGAKDLLFVQILWRHGDRAPITLYPNDPNPESVWLEGLGKLTILGRKQHYAYGKYLRKMYENFGTWSPAEVEVISSDCDRCLKSAETNLASFFAPSPKWQFEPDLDWQPLSIHYIPQEQDKYLETDSYCPKADVEEKRILDSPKGQEFISEHKKMFDKLTVESGTPITNWTAASYLRDTLKIEKRYNLTIPAWTDSYWMELENVADLAFYWSFKSFLMQRLRAGPFLGRMIDLMQKKVNGDLPKLKFQLYSSHDTNIAVVLNALHLFNMKQPPYCASLFFELYQEDGDSYLRLLYQNSTQPEIEVEDPHVLILDGCTEFCPLDQFINLTKSLIPDGWERECQLKLTFLGEIAEKSVTLGLFFSMMAVIILVISVYSLRRICNHNREKYPYTLMPME